MSDIKRAAVTAHLTQLIDQWLKKYAGQEPLYSEIEYLGDDIGGHMAQAATAVLFASTDSQRYAVKEGYLNR